MHYVARNNWIFVKKLWTEHEFKWHGLYLIIRAKRMFLLSVMQKEMTSNHEVFDFTSSNSRTEQIQGSCTLGRRFHYMKNQFWAVSCGLWSGLDYEKKGVGQTMSNFWGPLFKAFMDKKLIQFFFWKYLRVRTEKLHKIKVNKSQKHFEKYFLHGKNQVL